MIFKNTKRFSPVALKLDMPHKYDLFHHDPSLVPSNKELFKKYIKENNIVTDSLWWQKQWDRCIYGYTIPDAVDKGGTAYVDGVDSFWYEDNCSVPIYDVTFKNRMVHISGRMYFYLNFWLIYGLLDGTEVKGLMNPKFLDMDYFYARRIEMMFEQHKDRQELKGRQSGFSEKIAGMEIAYNFTFVPASVNIITAGTQADADHTMENCERGLDHLINTQFYQRRAIGGDSKVLLRAAKKKSEIRALTAKDKPQSISRFTPFYVVHEEVGKGKANWSLDVEGFVKPSQSAQGIKTGYSVSLGTGGDMNAGAQDLEERHYNPDKHNILSFPEVFSEVKEPSLRVGHFTPKWMFVKIDEDGNSLKPESLKWIEEEIGKETNAKDRYIATTQYAIFDHNVFMIEAGGFFGKEAALLLNKRKNWMRSHPNEHIIQIGRLEWLDKTNKNKGVKWVADADGWLKVAEHPAMDPDKKLIYANLYEGATDSYDQDEAHTSDSKGCIVIRKGYVPNHAIYNTFVAMVLERPSIEEGGAETFYEHTAMLCMYYGCQNSIEYSNLRIFDYYTIINNFSYLLKPRPRLAFAGKIKNTQVSNPYGIDKSLKAPSLAILQNRMNEDYISRLLFKEIVEAWIKFKYDPSGKKYNCDITVSTAYAEVAAKEVEFQVVMKTEDLNKTRPKSIAYKQVGGQLVPCFV